MKPSARPVLVIAGYAPSLINFRWRLLQAIREKGHEVIAAAPQLLEDRAVVDKLRTLDIRCQDVPLRRAGLNPIADLRLFASLVRLMRAERPEAMLGYTPKPVIFGLLAARLAGVPRRYALITGLGYAFAEGAGGKSRLVREIQTMLYRIGLKVGTKVFFQNHDDPALFRELHVLPRKLPVVVVNGSGIDLEQFGAAPLPNSPPRFLLIARLIASKGIREYAQAARRIRERHPGVQFHLVGGLDPNPDGLSSGEVEQWQAEGTLIWHGEAADVRPHIAACHVYVLPSYYREGTPRSILEALAVGRAVITTDAPGCRETVVDGENGFLVPPRDAASLATAMQRFIDEPGLIETMGRRSRTLAETKYDVNQVNAEMLKEMELA